MVGTDGSGRVVRFDALDPAVVEDPYPTYAELRGAGPLCRGGPGQWVVPRYAEVAALLRDRRLSHEFPAEYYRFSVGDGLSLLLAPCNGSGSSTHR